MLSRFGRLAAHIGHARSRHLLLTGGVLLGLLLAFAALWFLVELRRDDITDAARELKNLSVIMAEETDQEFQAAELLQLGLIEHIRALGITSPADFERAAASAEMHQNLRDRVAGLPNIDNLSLEDVRGSAISASSRKWPSAPNDLSGREFFRRLTADSALVSWIGVPVRSLYNGLWVIMFTRKVTAQDGRLLGFVNTAIQLAHFEREFAKIMLNGGGSFVLYRRDGTLLARYPHIDPLLGTTFAGNDNFHLLLDTQDGGTLRLTSMMDGKYRLIAVHSVAHYPLIITVTEKMASVLSGWRNEVMVFGGGTAFLELVVAAIVLLGIRHVRGYETLQAAEAELAIARERERSALALREQWTNFDTTLSNLRQGVCLSDETDCVLVLNRRFNEIFGLGDDSIPPGTPYHEITARVVAAGQVSAADMQDILDRRRNLIEGRTTATFNWRLTSGRILTVTHQPMQNGWLATYEDITERCLAEARVAHMANHDGLTNLPNRVLFRTRLDTALAYARRGHMLALLCLDLDQFKSVNDTLGHPIGDRLLKSVARRLADRTRETDTVARLGGDEFAIVQTEIQKPVEATAFAARLIDLVAEPIMIDGHQIVIGTSIGIALAPQDGLDPDQLLRCADLALYRAKVDGRGVYRLFQAEMDAQMQARRLMELDLRQAVHAGQLEVFYQPVIDLGGNAVAGFEALLRWRHPKRGIVPPGDFIALAEEIGLIVSIGEWVLQQACADAATWPGNLKVAVNLSPAQFRSCDLINAVSSALNSASLMPARLELEITETVMLQDTDTTLAMLHELHSLGVRIAMDDFGTGYSSLSYLRRFPFDRIKIDQSFVRELIRPDCAAIVRAVTGLSSELGIATTAEGVETSEQLNALASVGCNEVQGYLFSPAVPAREIPGLLLRLSSPTSERSVEKVLTAA